MGINLENVESKFNKIVKTSEWDKLQQDFIAADDIFVIGNGGNFAVASHAATDASRLLPKCVTTLDSPSMLTSTANDFGYENIFKKWLEDYKPRMRENSMIVGLSSSGNSKNIVDALEWGLDNGCTVGLISGQKSKAVTDNVNEVNCECSFFHTHEILCLMLFYELIHNAGGHCPSILDEVERKTGKPIQI